MNRCEIGHCKQEAFATEKLTKSDMKLCREHFKELFSNIFSRAEIIDMTGEDDV